MTTLKQFLADKVAELASINGELGTSLNCLKEYLHSDERQRIFNSLIIIEGLEPVDVEERSRTNNALSLFNDLNNRKLECPCIASSDGWQDYLNIIRESRYEIKPFGNFKTLEFVKDDNLDAVYTEAIILDLIKDKVIRTANTGSVGIEGLDATYVEKLTRRHLELSRLRGKYQYHSHNHVVDLKGNVFIINPLLELGKWLEEYKNGKPS